MLRKGCIVIASIFLILTFFSKLLLGDGMVVPTPPPGMVVPTHRYIDVMEHHVKADINDNIALVTVEEVFRNPYKFRVEGDYLFPIPKDASISKFSVFVGDKELKGEILSRDEARRIYEEIVRKMKDPALLEYYNTSLFRARIFPIPPGKSRKIVIKYEEILHRVGTAYQWCYPLKIEGLSYSKIDQVSVKIHLRTKEPIRSAYSPTHSLEIVSRGPNELVGVYEDNDVRPRSDFIFFFVPTRKKIAMNIIPYHEDKAESGYFLLTLSPGYWREEREIPKDVVFAIDVSGSMKGKKIEDAKKALSYFLTALNREDRFAIVTFSGTVSEFSKDWKEADEENRQEAKDYVESLIAEGGTNFFGALERALSYQKEDRRPIFIVFLTDGAPTVGPTDPEKIIGMVKDLISSQRIFVFGVGENVNTILLDRLARMGHGSATYVRWEDNLEEILSAFYNKIAFPAITDVRLNFEGIVVRDLYPQDTKDLFYGEDLVFAGKYFGGGECKVSLKGIRKGENLSVARVFNFPERDTRFPYVGRIWAMRRVADLLDRIRREGENEKLVEEITNLGKEFGIVTPYTSFLVEEAKGVAPMSVPKEALRQESGKMAFRVARALSGLRESRSLYLPGEKDLPLVYTKGKTFYLKDSVWVDVDFKEGTPVEEIEFGSKKYFDFVRENPDVVPFISLGKEVLFVYKGRAYKIKA